ncbi:MAG TPA: hypothetical protein VL981_09335, partial [Candidatus Methylacidiphilales bacterium]|nr:hypothetical protein [Candidatus Methylacidiphilales bacterium]
MDTKSLPNHHYFILSPWEYRDAYIAYGIHWLSSLICIAVSFYFFRQKKGVWWLLIALAFFLPLAGQLAGSLWYGEPLLPWGLVGPDQGFSSDNVPAGYPGGFIPGAFTRTVQVFIPWDFISPIVAIALAWAYLADKSSVKSG